jgi:hypothetical protein
MAYIVPEYDFPCDSFVFQTQVDRIEDDGIEQIQP